MASLGTRHLLFPPHPPTDSKVGGRCGRLLGGAEIASGRIPRPETQAALPSPFSSTPTRLPSTPLLDLMTHHLPLSRSPFIPWRARSTIPCARLGTQMTNKCWLAGPKGSRATWDLTSHLGILLVPAMCAHSHKASVKTEAWCCSASLEPGRRLDLWGQDLTESPVIKKQGEGARGREGDREEWQSSAVHRLRNRDSRTCVTE